MSRGKSTVPRLTLEIVRNALIEANGIKADAARALGVSRAAITGWVHRYPVLNQDIEDCRQSVDDQAIKNLSNKVMEGDLKASEFWIRNLQRKNQHKIKEDKQDQIGRAIEFCSDEELKKLERILQNQQDGFESPSEERLFEKIIADARSRMHKAQSR